MTAGKYGLSQNEDAFALCNSLFSLDVTRVVIHNVLHENKDDND